MSDADSAQDIEIREWERNNAGPKGQFKYAPDESGYGPDFCSECDAKMNPARQGYGFKNCVECQSAKERGSIRRY